MSNQSATRAEAATAADVNVPFPIVTSLGDLASRHILSCPMSNLPACLILKIQRSNM